MAGSLGAVTTPPFPPVSETDLDVLRTQLGRPARGVVGIAARCVCGNPTVAATAPRLADGTPFPTLYYLSLPSAVVAMSTLEATGAMKERGAMNQPGARSFDDPLCLPDPSSLRLLL